jgi:hypothetical protein
VIDIPSLEALIELANRAPKSRTEALFLRGVVDRLNVWLRETAQPGEGGEENARYPEGTQYTNT